MARSAPLTPALVTGALSLLMAGCAAPRVVSWSHGPEVRPALPAGAIAVSTPVFLAEVPGAASTGVYEDNLLVGHVHHAGGYVLAETTGGSVHRSLETGFSMSEEYGQQVKRWLSGVMQEALVQSGRPLVDGPKLDPKTLPSPERVPVRGSHPDDGRDNLNLPRYRLAPVPLTTPVDVPLLLVPYVLAYYTHNGGWFSGQTWGCGGGARIRLLWVVYEGKTGTPLAHGEVDARTLEPMEHQPGRSRVEDFLMQTEAEAGARLTRVLDEVL